MLSIEVYGHPVKINPFPGILLFMTPIVPSLGEVSGLGKSQMKLLLTECIFTFLTSLPPLSVDVITRA